jgi:hypothetical protein
MLSGARLASPLAWRAITRLSLAADPECYLKDIIQAKHAWRLLTMYDARADQ